MKAHADKAISDENREKIAPKQKSSLLKEIVTKATFAKLTTAPVVMTTEAPTTITTVSMTTTDVEVSRKTTLTSDGKKPWTFLKTLFKNYMFATLLIELKKKHKKLFPSHYSIPLILWKCSFYTYFKTDMFTFWDLELQRKMRKIKLRMDCCESGREAGEGAEDDPWGICVNLSHKFSRKIRKGRRKCRTYFMKCCIEEAER